ncbi:MAG: hypothetical protein KAW14_11915 [Candidatus Aegiribacteria sp.]|nr:hypothetical protein [Candidatus Aegiribacteria sp.]
MTGGSLNRPDIASSANKVWILGAIACFFAFFVPRIEYFIPGYTEVCWDYFFNWQFSYLPFMSYFIPIVAIAASITLAVVSTMSKGKAKAITFVVIGFSVWLLLALQTRHMFVFARGCSHFFSYLFLLLSGGAIAGSIMRNRYPNSIKAKLLGGITAAAGAVLFFIVFIITINDYLFDWLIVFTTASDIMFFIALISWMSIFAGFVLVIVNFANLRNSRIIARISLWLMLSGVVGAFIGEMVMWIIYLNSTVDYAAATICFTPFEDIIARVFQHIKFWLYWVVFISAAQYGAVKLLFSSHPRSSTRTVLETIDHEFSSDAPQKATPQPQHNKAEPQTLFCPGCGERIRDKNDVTFCRYCGYKLH